MTDKTAAPGGANARGMAGTPASDLGRPAGVRTCDIGRRAKLNLEHVDCGMHPDFYAYDRRRLRERRLEGLD